MKTSPETKARRAAARKREKELSKLKSVADRVQVEEKGGTTFLRFWIADIEITGTDLDNFNIVLEKLGYRPVRITSNLLNPAAKPFAIDINTPSYCDVGSEAYWSM